MGTAGRRDLLTKFTDGTGYSPNLGDDRAQSREDLGSKRLDRLLPGNTGRRIGRRRHGDGGGRRGQRLVKWKRRPFRRRGFGHL